MIPSVAAQAFPDQADDLTLPQTARLLQIVAALRHPESGCPWDLKQTHRSLRPYLLEEAYEAVEAIDHLPDDPKPQSPELAAFQGELGDVLLQVALHAQLQQEAGGFDFEAIAKTLADKLVRRHPHVFEQANDAIRSPEQVTAQWQQIKAAEQSEQNNAEPFQSLLGKSSQSGPALSHAFDISKKAVALGFTWPSFEALWQCVQSEFVELAELLPPFEDSPMSEAHIREQTQTNAASIEEELGDLLFATVNLARGLGVHPEVALSAATRKFRRRFEAMEKLLGEPALDAQLVDTPVSQALQAREQAARSLSFQAWDALWTQAKQQVQTT